MVKRKIRALVVMAFGVALAAFSVLDGSTQCAELAMLQDAMRELRRTDNLEFSYESTIAGTGVSKGEKTVVWADTLSGSWVSEHYITDEDGTRRYLKKFCDGTSVYQYVEWNGEWNLSEDESTEIPYFAQLVDLPYDENDIYNISLEQRGKVLELSYEFTPEYIERQNRKRTEALEKYYRSYRKKQTSEEALDNVELAVEQYRQTREEETAVTYRIDSAGVMRGLHCTMTLVSPEIVYDESGQQALGAERESFYVTTIEISRYNQDGILNKIDQCRLEVSYY